MARLNRALSITASQTVTAATLHSLIESAVLTGISASDVEGFNGSAFISAGTSTPDPSVSRFWYDTSNEDPVFRVYASPFNIWLAAGPDRFEIPLLNASGGTARKGAMVVASGASSFDLAAAGASLNVIGFLQATTASGAYGPVATCGLGWATWVSGHSGCTIPSAGRALINRGCPLPGTCTALDIFGVAGSGPMFGQYLDDSVPTDGCKLIHIWGPRLTE